MAKKILPYRDYSEHDVLNLFSLDVASSDTLTEWVEASNGKWDSGVVVQVKAGDLPGDLPGEGGLKTSGKLRAYLGSDPSSAHIGFNAYPSNGMTVEPADDASAAIGITLRETLAYDENGEKLLYYKRKLDEAQAVLPGQTVPVLTRGTVTLTVGTANAAVVDADLDNVVAGAKLTVGANGVLNIADPATDTVVGSIIAIGKDSDVDGTSKALCRINF